MEIVLDIIKILFVSIYFILTAYCFVFSHWSITLYQ